MPDSPDRYVGLVTDEARQAAIEAGSVSVDPFTGAGFAVGLGIAAALRSLHEAGRIVLADDLEQVGWHEPSTGETDDLNWGPNKTGTRVPVFRMKDDR